MMPYGMSFHRGITSEPSHCISGDKAAHYDRCGPSRRRFRHTITPERRDCFACIPAEGDRMLKILNPAVVYNDAQGTDIPVFS